MNTAEPQGCLPGILAWAFGPQAKRLREQATHAHWLSYLLIISQSIAVVLVFGHAEVSLLLSPSAAVRVMALLALFVLVITVIAADLALVETMKRIPILKRNRQAGALFEHRAYQWFVLVVEGATYGVVLYTLDSDPQALVQSRSLIPTTGVIFLALVVMRVTLISWSAVQLIIVRGKLPVLLSTLMNTGKEIVGAHLEHQLETMNIADMAMHDLFGVYARMVQPPRPIAGLLNFLTAGWLVRRALLAEAEEDRQALNVKAALATLQGAQQPVTPPGAQMTIASIEASQRLPTAAPGANLSLPHDGSASSIGVGTPPAAPTEAYQPDTSPDEPPDGPGSGLSGGVTGAAPAPMPPAPTPLIVMPARRSRKPAAVRARERAAERALDEQHRQAAWAMLDESDGAVTANRIARELHIGHRKAKRHLQGWQRRQASRGA